MLLLMISTANTKSFLKLINKICTIKSGLVLETIDVSEFFQKGKIIYLNISGSHDNPDILPLKAGVCIMAMGAMAKYNCKVNIVTCGLNYYQGHKFRSKVIFNYRYYLGCY